MQGMIVDTTKNDALAITKSDTTIFNPPVRGLYVGGLGDVAVVTQDGSAVTFTAVPAGTYIPIGLQKVMSTGTTATNIVGLR